MLRARLRRKDGRVLFSQAHATATWWEQNIVADPNHSIDRRSSSATPSEAYVTAPATTERPIDPAIATNNAFNGMIDHLDKGLSCATNEDCPSKNCQIGLLPLHRAYKRPAGHRMRQ